MHSPILLRIEGQYWFSFFARGDRTPFFFREALAAREFHSPIAAAYAAAELRSIGLHVDIIRQDFSVTIPDVVLPPHPVWRKYHTICADEFQSSLSFFKNREDGWSLHEYLLKVTR